MISEHQFANHHSSAWNTVTPLSDGFWSFENKRVERIEPPLVERAPKGMRAIINEMAFRAFCATYPLPRPTNAGQLDAAVIASAEPAVQYIRRFSNAPAVGITDIDATCLNDATLMAKRLLSYFPIRPDISLRPRFAGCGLISACEGDVIAGSCLYEVKAGDRAFRIFDLRQLLTYSALAYASNNLHFTHIGIINPRTGVVWRRSLVDVCIAVSGLQPNDTLPALIEQFSAAAASR